jgi:hypothetical protein
MSYDICIYFRDPLTGKIENPYGDNEPQESSDSANAAQFKRNQELASRIHKRYADIFTLDARPELGSVDLLWEEWKKDYSFNIGFEANLMTLYLRFSDIQADEKDRNKIIEDIVWMVAMSPYDSVIDDPQIGMVYIPSRLFKSLKDQFEWVELTEYREAKDFCIDSPSFDRWVAWLKEIGMESEIQNYAQWLINLVQDKIVVNFSNEWLANFIVVLQDTADRKNETRDTADIEAQVRLCGSFLGEHIKQNISGARWKYAPKMEDSVLEFVDKECIYYTLSPYKEINSIISKGHVQKSIVQLYETIGKKSTNAPPFWKRLRFWQIVWILCVIISIATKSYQAEMRIEKIESQQTQEIREQTKKVIISNSQKEKPRELTLTYNPENYTVTRTDDVGWYSILVWEVRDATTSQLLSSRRVHEKSYRHYDHIPWKTYEIFLSAFDGSEHTRVSNIIKYTVGATSSFMREESIQPR